MSATRATEARVQIRRTIQAPQARVFDAWIDPAMMSKWFARAPGTPPGVVVTADARPGGRYVVDVVSSKDGKTYRMQGEYREVTPHSRLSFTWSYKGGDFPTPSLVTIEFHAAGHDATDVVLTHEQLPASQIEPHRAGWLECLSQLDQALAGAI